MQISHLGRVRLVERSHAGIKGILALDPSRDQVVDKGASLRGGEEGFVWRKEEIVVHQEGAVIDLDEQILLVIFVQQIPGDPRALRHPVQPDAADGPVNVVVADYDIDRSVEFDSRHLGAGEQALHMDVMDGVAGDGAERTPHTAHDAGLFAMGDVVVADDMVADGFLIPGLLEGAFDGLDVPLSRIGRLVVPLVTVLAQGDAGASRKTDDIVLDDPAPAPVGADQPDLLCRRRRPGRGRVAHDEPAHRQEVDPCLLRVKNRLASVNLHKLLVGVHAREARPDRGIRRVHLAEPKRIGARRLQHLFQRRRLVQPFAVEIDSPCVMLPAFRIKPIAVDEIAVGVELAKEGVGKRYLPDFALDFFPAFDDLRALDNRFLAGCRLVNDAQGIGLASARRGNALAVNAFMHGDRIARLRELRATLDGAQRGSLRSGVGVISMTGDMDFTSQRCGGKGESG